MLPQSESSARRLVDVQIVLYRPDPDLLRLTLKSLAGQAIRTIRIHKNFLDNTLAADGETQAWDWLDGIQGAVITASDNLGFAAAHNMLLRKSFSEGASHSLVLNPDLELTPTAVKDLVDSSNSIGDLHLVSGILLLRERGVCDDPGVDVIDTRGIEWTSNARHLDKDQGKQFSEQLVMRSEVAGLSGAQMLVPRAAHDRIVALSGEFFDEDFFAYREDAELGVRAGLLGVASVVVEYVTGTHFRGSPGTTRANPLVNRLSVRNRFFLRFKLGPDRPGTVMRSTLRDVAVVIAAFSSERSSAPAVREALRGRPGMQAKRELFLSGLQRPSPSGPGSATRLRAKMLAPIPSEGPYEPAIVVPIFKPGNLNRDLLNQWAQASLVIIVRDDADSQAFQHLDPSIIQLSMLRNNGIAAALNVGIAYAYQQGCTVVSTIDQDSFISRSDVARLQKRVIEDRRLVIGPGQIDGVAYRADPNGKVAEILQSGLTTRMDTFVAIGMFNELLFIDGVDSDFCLRARSNTYKVCIDADVTMTHALGDGSSRRPLSVGPFQPVVTGHSAFRRYYMTRNRISLVRKYWWREPRWAAVTVRRTVVGNILAVSLENNRREKFQQVIGGLRDGIRGRSGRRA